MRIRLAEVAALTNEALLPRQYIYLYTAGRGDGFITLQRNYRRAQLWFGGRRPISPRADSPIHPPRYVCRFKFVSKHSHLHPRARVMRCVTCRAIPNANTKFLFVSADQGLALLIAHMCAKIIWICLAGGVSMIKMVLSCIYMGLFVDIINWYWYAHQNRSN